LVPLQPELVTSIGFQDETRRGKAEGGKKEKRLVGLRHRAKGVANRRVMSRDSTVVRQEGDRDKRTDSVQPTDRTRTDGEKRGYRGFVKVGWGLSRHYGELGRFWGGLPLWVGVIPRALSKAKLRGLQGQMRTCSRAKSSLQMINPATVRSYDRVKDPLEEADHPARRDSTASRSSRREAFLEALQDRNRHRGPEDVVRAAGVQASRFFATMNPVGAGGQGHFPTVGNSGDRRFRDQVTSGFFWYPCRRRGEESEALALRLQGSVR